MDQSAPTNARRYQAGRLDRGGVGWALYEGARVPIVSLVIVFLFLPYISSTLVGDPVLGQELISRHVQYAGWIVALTAPFMGLVVDHVGRRKPWLLAITVLLVAANILLWWAKPGNAALPLGIVMALVIFIYLAYSYSEVVHNAMLVGAAGVENAHRASGLGLALGNLISLMALAFVGFAFVLPGQVDWSWLPSTPLFGLDSGTHEAERMVAPLAAIVLALGAIPLFLFTPDTPRSRISVMDAVRGAGPQLWSMLKGLRGYRDGAIFLVARMFYSDGGTALVTFVGIYAAGVMGWGSAELLLYGMLFSLAGMIGGLTGRWMDGAIGPKRAVQVSIGVLLLGIVLLIGMGRDRIAYVAYDVAATGRVWAGPFGTWPELCFVVTALTTTLFVTAQYASSRSLLVLLTPPERSGAFFGIYALSGTATIWLGAMLVNLGTRITHSQQGGFIGIALLLALGFGILLFVDVGRRPNRAALPVASGPASRNISPDEDRP